ncbi:DNA cytosine methyltransferase [Cellulosimicrobium cellulans]|uniref:DNA cytosine methyltransferase n=1 Tax=Cellulosimicrobium cellulans TaxID=1710 RepID=UPI001EDA71D8|nr:DNA cytosine methyltransferase [Cellulosimicrobium cellulans]UKJ62600.1 DNA cytosine methyltransferase [Cellulosimicrobium cellulans]
MGQSTDLHELRQTDRPEFEVGPTAITLVDLFAGCGGLTLGAAQAAADHNVATDIRLAVDLEESATSVYAENFKKAAVETSSIDEHFNGKLGARLTALEKRTRDRVGELDLLVGGPPCQGHSDLNNHTRRDDPKNALYARMARAAEVLRPRFVLIENVPTVRNDISDVVGTTRAHLEAKGYVVADAVVSLHALGVAQRRKRHIMLASRAKGVDPQEILNALTARNADPGRNLQWAIGDLAHLGEPSGYDIPPRASEENIRRMQFLLEEGLFDLPNEQRPLCHRDSHSYKSMYGRLKWDLPAQTITSGFGSIGQGRYMHPDRARALTPHEAARLQGFPDYFDFSTVKRRADLATMIGNAVPPALAREIVAQLIPSITSTRRPGERNFESVS